MNPAAAWHPGEDVLQDYVDGGLPGLSAGSVEAHLLGCAACRAQLRDAVRPDRLARLREDLDDALDRAQRPRLERLLTRCGMHEADARALLAAPSLRRAWWLAVMAAALLGLVVAANGPEADALFLLLAPLLPLAATAVAYAPSLDPAFGLVAATPYRTVRLLLTRSLAVGVVSLLCVTLASLALPARDVTEVVWLLPALALTLAVLALSPRLGTVPAAALVAGGWVLLVGSLERRGFDLAWMQDPAAQSAFGLAAGVAAAVLAHQWTRLDGGERS